MKRAYLPACIPASLLVLQIAACTGAQGATGKPGADGQPGTPGAPGTGSTPSVSAVLPPSAYLGRTVDLTVVGSGTSWASATTVTFANPGVTVNKVTVASASGLLVNVTIGASAALGATDVTVTTGSTKDVYAGAFKIDAPLAVTTDQTGGVPQGGYANVHVDLLDLSTPFDPNTAMATLSATDVGLAGTPTVADFTLDMLVAADVLATAGESVDLTVTSGPSTASVTSPAKGAFKVAARTPTPLVDGTQATGMIATSSDSSLFVYKPAAAATRFVQLNILSPDGGGLLGIAIPKSGKQADALGGFGVRFGIATASTDPTYVILTDGGSPFANPPPYSFQLNVTETPCTVVTPSGVHTTSGTALPLTMLPALAQTDFGNGSNTAGDYYSLTVPAGKTMLHAATGGDGLSDMIITVYDSTGTNSIANSPEDDAHKDVVTAVTAGTYFVNITAGQSFDPTHSTYDLFVELQ